MQTYIALLRGINVSGKKKVIMTELKDMFEHLGYIAVVTYIQSGNVVFKAKEETIQLLEEKIHKGIGTRFGYNVPVLVMISTHLQAVYDQNPFLQRIKEGQLDEKKMYFTLLSDIPEVSTIEKLDIRPADGEEYILNKNHKVVYLYAAQGYGKTKLTNNLFEQKLKCNATTRNLKTTVKLLELSFLSC
ncbi:DUF1697 domain-containing protein [Aquimarina addita]|uniref:DUF1697 domain-containing protein n=1 Tax=Aquimarina addita TaxID=870485 RepID=A0ABP6UUR4_9FLAO